MAAASYVRGKFVCAKVKSWGAFHDRDGAPVEPGESLSVWVYTPHDDELCIVKPKREQDARIVLKEIEALSLKFGDDVEIVTGALQNGAYRGVFGVARPGKS